MFSSIINNSQWERSHARNRWQSHVYFWQRLSCLPDKSYSSNQSRFCCVCIACSLRLCYISPLLEHNVSKQIRKTKKIHLITILVLEFSFRPVLIEERRLIRLIFNFCMGTTLIGVIYLHYFFRWIGGWGGPAWGCVLLEICGWLGASMRWRQKLDTDLKLSCGLLHCQIIETQGVP